MSKSRKPAKVAVRPPFPPIYKDKSQFVKLLSHIFSGISVLMLATILVPGMAALAILSFGTLSHLVINDILYSFLATLLTIFHAGSTAGLAYLLYQGFYAIYHYVLGE